MEMEALNSTLPAIPSVSISAIPTQWMERIFQKMEDRYGEKWEASYGAFPRARVMRSWGEDLADMLPSEIIAGMEASRSSKFPPTLPEFRAFCRPDRALQNYLLGMNAIASGDYAGHTALYWAVQRFGYHEFKLSSWDKARPRWTDIFNQCVDENRRGQLPCIPINQSPAALLESLPARPEKVAEVMASVAEMMEPKRDRKEWARRLLRGNTDGSHNAFIAMEFAKETIGVSRRAA